jgi:putative transposase
MDKSAADYASLENINMLLILAGLISFIKIWHVNNLIEQAHRSIKKITKSMMGFQVFHSAKSTQDVIETAPLIRKVQLSEKNRPDYKQFMALAD